jgi:Domain of unknown function (DUF4352)
MVRSSSCPRVVRHFLSALLASISLAGCMDLNRPVGQATQPCLAGGGTVVQDAFRVSVNDVRWTDRAMRAGMEYVPEAQRAMLGEQVNVRPQANFLVIDLQIINMTKRPIAWADYFPTYGKAYKLINEDGAVYEASPQLSNVISGTVGGNINPGMSAGGNVVFDVPKDKYDFIIEHTSFAGYGALTRYFSGTEVFRCSLPVA